ncbi:hypothetical protein OUZ56_015997 [Daphnia magna]|uniref:Uncharacterized protein n=1 Tax=Daphnia magna TaxID=35525 RepID=A0ABR0APC5_9CRUS|nr:hypothetical protein OUZ56_015997 [Daphnia magna]
MFKEIPKVGERVRGQCVKSDILALKTPSCPYASTRGQVNEMVEPRMNFILLLIRSRLSLRSRCPYYTTQQSLLAVFQCREFVMPVSMQLLNKELGGTVKSYDVHEDRQFEIQEEKECPLFKGLETRQLVLLTRGDNVE